MTDSPAPHAPPPPPPDVSPEAGNGCLRAAIIGLLFAVALVAAVIAAVVIVGDRSGDGPHLVVRTPNVHVGRTPAVGPPPDAVRIAATVRRRVAESVVRVTGTACQEIQQGSGFVAPTGDVITDAHVVAGERSTDVVDHNGVRRSAVVVLFDPARDLAVLRITSGPELPSLALVPPRLPSDLAVFGHPGGGPLRIAPARLSTSGRVEAVGRDIYGRSVPGTRQLLALAARLAPGDSGAPVVDTDGRVVAVAFAIDPGGKPIAYALTSSELSGLVVAPVAARTRAVSTGRCVSL